MILSNPHELDYDDYEQLNILNSGGHIPYSWSASGLRLSWRHFTSVHRENRTAKPSPGAIELREFPNGREPGGNDQYLH